MGGYHLTVLHGLASSQGIVQSVLESDRIAVSKGVASIEGQPHSSVTPMVTSAKYWMT